LLKETIKNTSSEYVELCKGFSKHHAKLTRNVTEKKEKEVTTTPNHNSESSIPQSLNTTAAWYFSKNA